MANFDPKMIQSIAGAVGSMKQGQQSGGGGGSSSNYKDTDIDFHPLSNDPNAGQVKLDPSRQQRVSNFAGNFSDVYRQNGMWNDHLNKK